MVYGDVISLHRAGSTRFFHFDGLGSTDALSDSNATVTDRYNYTGFGNGLTTIGNSTNHFRYVGRRNYYYESDLLAYLLSERFYKPTEARFLSRDLSSRVLASYVYVSNRPIIFVDVTGTFEVHAQFLSFVSPTLAVPFEIDQARVEKCIAAFPRPVIPDYPIVKPPDPKCIVGCLQDPKGAADCIVEKCLLGLIGKDPRDVVKETLYLWMASIVCCNTAKFPTLVDSINPCRCQFVDESMDTPIPEQKKPVDKKRRKKWKCINPLKGECPPNFKQDECLNCCAFLGCVQSRVKMDKLDLVDLLGVGFDLGACLPRCAK
jgi:RHS repeat-associated protein